MRPDKPAKNVPSKLELDALLARTVETALGDARDTIKATLTNELEGIMRRLEEYQATSKLLSAKQLHDRDDTYEIDLSDTDTVTTRTRSALKKEHLSMDPSNVVVGDRLGVGGSGCVVRAFARARSLSNASHANRCTRATWTAGSAP